METRAKALEAEYMAKLRALEQKRGESSTP